MTLEELQAGQVFLVDKPKGWTSFDVLRKMQRHAGYKKFGHAGTLDPLATGLLIVCAGKATKTIHEYQAAEKEYLADFVLGGTTKTYDAEFAPENLIDTSHLSNAQVHEALARFRGEITQVPPVYSAIKVQGKRAYELARKNIDVTLKARTITVHEYELLDLRREQGPDGPEQIRGRARIVCSKGTYIRSLAHDLGRALGVGGYLGDLRRTRIGEYSVESAETVDTLLRRLPTKHSQRRKGRRV